MIAGSIKRSTVGLLWRSINNLERADDGHCCQLFAVHCSFEHRSSKSREFGIECLLWRFNVANLLLSRERGRYDTLFSYSNTASPVYKIIGDA